LYHLYCGIRFGYKKKGLKLNGWLNNQLAHAQKRIGHCFCCFFWTQHVLFLRSEQPVKAYTFLFILSSFRRHVPNHRCNMSVLWPVHTEYGQPLWRCNPSNAFHSEQGFKAECTLKTINVCIFKVLFGVNWLVFRICYAPLKLSGRNKAI
jgi:hypothetical protein